MKLPESFRHHRLFARTVNRQYHTRGGLHPHNTEGIDIFAENWDTLVILDGCRYDLFADNHTLGGKLSKRISRGSATNEWLQANFAGHSLHDVVYVTANPMFHRHREIFDLDVHAVVDIAETDWDNELGTVPPKAVTSRAIEAHKQFPRKRIIVHYMQPHYPFIDGNSDISARHERETHNIWNELVRSECEISGHTVRRAYERNLAPVLPPVKKLIESIEGLTVVSSDHGNMLGERSYPLPVRDWGHPPGIYTSGLVDVPWLVRDRGERRDVSADHPIETDEKRDVDSQLRSLGYKS